MSVNKVILLGNLGKDPETRRTASQTAVCSFSIATTERRKEGSEWKDHTEWHNIIAFGKTAENCGKYLSKGSKCFVEGRLQTRKWQDKEGRDRWTTEVVALNVQFLGSKSEVRPAQQQQEYDPFEASIEHQLADKQTSFPEKQMSFDDDDIPF